MNAGLILNNSAGTDFAQAEILKMFESHNIKVTVHDLKAGKLNDAVKTMKDNGIEILIGGGGDGTIGAAASAAIENNLPLGILPLGTLNHFAKDLNIPLKPEEAIAVIAKKNLLKIDVGDLNGNIFINNSSLGFYPRLVKHRDEEKKKMGKLLSGQTAKWFAMFKAFFKVFKILPVLKVKITSDVSNIHCKIPFVFIGNNEYEMDLFNLGTRTSISNGSLSLYYPIVTDTFSILKFFFLSLIKRLEQQKNFRIEKVTGLTIESRKRKLEVSLDGEVTHMAPPLNYKIRPLELTVIVPEAK